MRDIRQEREGMFEVVKEREREDDRSVEGICLTLYLGYRPGFGPHL